MEHAIILKSSGESREAKIKATLIFIPVSACKPSLLSPLALYTNQPRD